MSGKQEQVLKIDPPVELTFTGKNRINSKAMQSEKIIQILHCITLSLIFMYQFRTFSSSSIFNHDTYEPFGAKSMF